MIINHNIAALNTLNRLNAASNAQSKSMEKLSSGLRINRAGDDAAGLAISEKMRAQIRGLDQATRNAQDGISLIQTAEGALNETHSILQRMRELATQASNDTATDADRSAIQKEISQLKDEINRISDTTEFNTKKLLDGSLEKAGLSLGTKLESIKLDGTATQGTNTSSIALDPTVNIVTGVNDQIKLNVDGAGAQPITIAKGQYTRESLITAINDAIGKNSNLAGKVTAELTSDNKLTFISTSTGTSSSVAVSAGTNDGRYTLGFTNAVTAGVTTSADVSGGSAVTLSSTAANVKLVVGSKAVNVDLYNDYGLTSFTNNTTTRDALQRAFDDNFGVGAVTVAINGSSLTYTSKVGQADVVSGITGSNDVTLSASTNTITFSTGTMTTGSQIDGAAATDVATSSTRLVSLGDGEGNNLGLQSGNQINISVIVGGVEKTASLVVTGTNTLGDLANAIRDTIGGTASVSIDSEGKIQITGQQGEAYAVSNLKLTAQKSATDTTAITGNFANKLSSYKETQAAEDAKVDSSLTFHIGANQAQVMKVDINEMSVKSLSLSSVDVSTQQGAETAITVINNAIDKVSAERSKLGAFQNRLEHSINNLGTSSENLTAAESRIRDVDMAKEMMEQTKASILAQAAQAMLAQANQQPQGVLQLLR
ncbi:flagellin [Bacillus smithii]|uniref:flagellin N-terminal helical domain-containing protein n=1 Tax=Bacillus smithii TaxID=1479 RepID=UPI003D1C0978